MAFDNILRFLSRGLTNNVIYLENELIDIDMFQIYNGQSDIIYEHQVYYDVKKKKIL